MKKITNIRTYAVYWVDYNYDTYRGTLKNGGFTWRRWDYDSYDTHNCPQEIQDELTRLMKEHLKNE